MNTTQRPKRPRDINQLAAQIVAEAVGEAEPELPEDNGKNPAYVERGRKGGLKGGKARAISLSSEQRVQIAKNAAKMRWNDK